MILTAAAFMLSVGVCRAQSGSVTPESKAEYFVERIFSAFRQEDPRFEQIGIEMGNYVRLIDEQQCERFGEHFAKTFYASSERYGYGKEFAEEFLKAFYDALLNKAEEEKTE